MNAKQKLDDFWKQEGNYTEIRRCPNCHKESVIRSFNPFYIGFKYNGLCKECYEKELHKLLVGE